MSDPRELELKLDILPADIAPLRTFIHQRLAATPPLARRLSSVYFDTPDLALRAAGLTLRLRDDGMRRVQTIKSSPASGAGLFDRSEWEWPAMGERPDLEGPVPDAVRAVLAAAGDRLEPVFESVVERLTWDVRQGGSVVEVALDDARISAGPQIRVFAELELELRHGAPADLFALVRLLHAVRPLRWGVLSKSERGAALVQGVAQRSFKAEPVALARVMSAGQAFQAVARGCVRQILLNEPLVVEVRRPEALHQMRVALRRLRSAFALFKPVIGDAVAAPLKDRLRAATQVLGDARNLDVYLKRMKAGPTGRGLSGPEDAAHLDEIERRRGDAYDAVVRQLGSADVRMLMLDLVEWIETGPWLRLRTADLRRARDKPVRLFAAALLDRRCRKVAKAARDLDRLSPAARHVVRIEAKKLRYAADFFAALAKRGVARERHRAFIAAMKRLQDALGELNDMTIGADLATISPADPAARLPEPGDPPLAAEESETRTADLLRAAAAAHRDLVACKRFWARWA